jgi:hypothetical protein
MSFRWSILPFGLLLLAGCLQEGPAPSGRRLFASQTLESPGFLGVGSETMVRFSDRKSFPTTTQGGVYDIWLSSFNGSGQRKVVESASDRWSEQGPDSAGGRYLMVDESRIASGAGTTPIATLVRFGPTWEEEIRIDGVSSLVPFSVSPQVLYNQPQANQSCPGFPNLQHDCPQLAYERPPVPGQTYPSLFLWDGANHLLIGADSGSFQFQTAGSGSSYFIRGAELMFTRLDRPSNTLEPLRSGVSRFALSGDEHYAALAVTLNDAQKTVILDLTTGTEIPVDSPNPNWGVSIWGTFGANTFYYSENATTSAPAELHALDLVTGQDQVTLVPRPLSNIAGAIDRPGSSGERLLLDTQGRGVFTAKTDFVALRTVTATDIVSPNLTADGNFLIYIEPVLPTLYDNTVRGALMIQDAELTQPARSLSTPGLQVPANGYFFTPGPSGPILVFWAHLGRANSDLFFADYLTGDMHLVAKQILSVSISAHNLFGILNASQQDGVGDLVYRDLDKNQDTVYAQAVAEDALLSGQDLSTSWTAYIVRGRTSSDHSGLWLTTLAPQVSPDGGTD